MKVISRNLFPFPGHMPCQILLSRIYILTRSIHHNYKHVCIFIFKTLFWTKVENRHIGAKVVNNSIHYKKPKIFSFLMQANSNFISNPHIYVQRIKNSPWGTRVLVFSCVCEMHLLNKPISKNKTTSSYIFKQNCHTPVLLKCSFPSIFGNQLYSNDQTHSYSSYFQCAFEALRDFTEETTI